MREGFAADWAIRHTVCRFSIQSGEGGKIARRAASFRPEGTGERGTGPDSPVFAWILSARNKSGSLSGFG
jgi:hypothetical protein